MPTKAKQLGPRFVVDDIARVSAYAVSVAQQASAEDVHRLRVAVRRLRLALTLFRRALPEAKHEALRRDLRWLFSALGTVRDLQLFASACRERVHAGARGEATLLRRLDADIARESRSLQALLASARYGRLQARLAEFAEDPELAAHGKRWFARRLAKKQKRALQALERAHTQTSRLHDARKAVKRLRYTAELAAPAFPKHAVHTYRKQLKRVQDALGVAVDLSIWKRMVGAECSTASLRDALTHQLAEEQAAAVARLSERITAFIECEGFWAVT